MKRSTDRILTTHAGSLIRPQALVEFVRARQQSPQTVDDNAYLECLKDSVAEVVKHQVEAGMDVINDGEQGKVNYVSYFRHRVTGFEGEPTPGAPQADVLEFPDFYKRVWWATPQAKERDS